MLTDKAKLKSALRKLRQIPFDRSEFANVLMAPQEMLDFLAMLAGLKPVYMLGCGFDDPTWVRGVTELAKSMGLKITAGLTWKSQPKHSDLPDWYVELLSSREGPPSSAVYICKSRDTNAAVEDLCSRPTVTIEEEAKLLGYPVCCVADRYRGIRLMETTLYNMTLRVSGADIDEMKRIILEDVQMTPETSEELAAAEDLHGGAFAPFTSISMCRKCAADPNSVAYAISAKYEALARSVDAVFADEIANGLG